MTLAPLSTLARKHIVLCAACMIAALLLVPFANRTARPVQQLLDRVPVDTFFELVGICGTATVLSFSAVLVYLLDPPRRRRLAYLILALLVAGGVNQMIKAGGGRLRPDHSVLMTEKEMRHVKDYVAKHPGTPVKAQRTDQWLLFRRGRPAYISMFTSFPSGDVVNAFVACAFLAILYPRARVVWFVLAIGCALARVRYRHHFTEDVLFASAEAWLLANWVFCWNWPAKLLNKLLPTKTESCPLQRETTLP